jgi:two-component system, NarL family, sensor histidine kinase UhpB
MPVASPRWIASALLRFRRLSLLKKTLIANSTVVFLGAVAGTYLTRELGGRHSGLTLALAFFTSGSLITILVNYLGFWDHFRPLLELSRALEAIRTGQEARRAVEGVRASGIADLLASTRPLLDRIEDDSLHFTARLLGSIEAERQRIGRELHDDTSQVLAAALLKVELCARRLASDPEGAREGLTSVRDLLTLALEQLKTAVYDLRPAMLDDLGLAAALRWYAGARVERPGVEVVVHLDEAPRLPAPLETALYRVGQEALANAVEHSGARRIELGLEIKPGYAVLTVFDDGQGFDLARARGRGLGLPSMRERVTQAGGEFNVVSEPGSGTRIYAVVAIPGPLTEGE